ncbi:MAG TPA: cell division protein FtsQ/DivIB [Solirubrobacteraceae bacterium]|jgi:cell division protein FtsQ|nr:cell division protein FtsQ/DivIB [Solirubrobacteraceae bacterium]
MSRSLAARAPGQRARRARPGSAGARKAPSWVRLPTLLAGAPRTLSGLLELLGTRRRLRIALVAIALALALLAGAWLWLRQSPFVSVEHVRITGVYGADAQAVQAALTQAAHEMSTLDVSDGSLDAAVAPLHVVRELRATPSFPHSLRIEVVEQPPVAALTVAGVRTAVAADGVVLGSTLASGSLPSVSGYRLPPPGGRVSGKTLLGELTVLGAAPAVLAAHIERVYSGSKGLTVAMHNGLLVYFGDDERPHAKWLSLARVLADPSSAGASYVDVRLPSHPAAGFPTGVTPPDAAATTGTTTPPGTAEPTGNSESTIEALAALLPGGSASASPAAEPPSSGASTPSGGETQSGAQAPPGTEAGSSTSGSTAPSTTATETPAAGTETGTAAGTETGAAGGAGAPSGG